MLELKMKYKIDNFDLMQTWSAITCEPEVFSCMSGGHRSLCSSVWGVVTRSTVVSLQ